MPTLSLHRPTAPASVTPLACAHGLDSLLALWAAGLTRGTHRTYASHLGRFAAALGVALDDLPATLLRDRAGTYAAVRRYRGALLARGCAPTTVNGAIAAVQSLLAVARSADLIDWHIDARAVPVVTYRDTRGPAPAVISALLAQAGAQPVAWRAARDTCVMRLLWDLGLRVGELTGLQARDVEWEGTIPSAIWIRGKGQHARTRLALPPTSQRALASWLAVASAMRDVVRSPDAPAIGLTPRGVATRLAVLSTAAGLPQVRPHGIRHASITTALEAGHSLRETRAFSRHRRIETLLTYDDHRLRGADVVAASLASRV